MMTYETALLALIPFACLLLVVGVGVTRGVLYLGDVLGLFPSDSAPPPSAERDG